MTNKKEINEMIIDLGILLDDFVIPYMLQRDYWDEMNGLSSWEAMDCMDRQVKMMMNVIRLYRLLSEIDVMKLM